MFTAFFGIAAFILMWIGGIRCNFLKFTAVSEVDDPVTMELGMWYYSFYSLAVTTSGTYIFESCNTYTEFTPIDATWKAARSFGIITFILAVIMLVAACISGCTSAQGDYSLTNRWEAPMYLLLTICQGLVLLLLASNACNSLVVKTLGVPSLSNMEFEETCGLATGANLVISATVFWFCAAVTSFMANKAERSEMTGDEGEAEKPAEEATAEDLKLAEEGSEKQEQAVEVGGE